MDKLLSDQDHSTIIIIVGNLQGAHPFGFGVQLADIPNPDGDHHLGDTIFMTETHQKSLGLTAVVDSIDFTHALGFFFDLKQVKVVAPGHHEV